MGINIFRFFLINLRWIKDYIRRSSCQTKLRRIRWHNHISPIVLEVYFTFSRRNISWIAYRFPKFAIRSALRNFETIGSVQFTFRIWTKRALFQKFTQSLSPQKLSPNIADFKIKPIMSNLRKKKKIFRKGYPFTELFIFILICKCLMWCSFELNIEAEPKKYWIWKTNRVSGFRAGHL